MSRGGGGGLLWLRKRRRRFCECERWRRRRLLLRGMTGEGGRRRLRWGLEDEGTSVGQGRIVPG